MMTITMKKAMMLMMFIMITMPSPSRGPPDMPETNGPPIHIPMGRVNINEEIT